MEKSLLFLFPSLARFRLIPKPFSLFHLSGLFVALGTADSTDIARKLGLVLEDNHIAIEPNTSTALPGLYAAGDCTGGMLQVAKAVYEGALAGTEAVNYLKQASKP